MLTDYTIWLFCLVVTPDRAAGKRVSVPKPNKPNNSITQQTQ
jgi:hypothetical protein